MRMGQKHFIEKKNLSTENPVLIKSIFQNKGETNTSSDMEKLKEFITSNPTLKEMSKEVL